MRPDSHVPHFTNVVLDEASSGRYLTGVLVGRSAGTFGAQKDRVAREVLKREVEADTIRSGRA